MREELVKKIRNLPPLPTILSRIVETIEDPNSSASDLEEIIRHDTALTGKLLAVANSASYSFRQEVTTVSRAVVSIGFEEVRNLCVGICMMGFLHPSVFGHKERAQSLWLHALAVAEAASLMARGQDRVKPDQAFAAGLLHDIGKVVSEAYFHNEVNALHQLVEERRIPYQEAEKSQGIEHDKLGLLLGRNWRLPPVLNEAIGRHHRLGADLAYPEMVSTVHLADYLAYTLDFPCQYRTTPPEIDEEGLAALGIDRQGLDEAGRTLGRRRNKIVSVWNKLLELE